MCCGDDLAGLPIDRLQERGASSTDKELRPAGSSRSLCLDPSLTAPPNSLSPTLMQCRPALSKARAVPKQQIATAASTSIFEHLYVKVEGLSTATAAGNECCIELFCLRS